MKTWLLVVLVVAGVPLSFLAWVILPRWGRRQGERLGRRLRDGN
jgi:hypothetical protein